MERNHRKLQELGLVGHEQMAVEKKAVKRVQAPKPVAAVSVMAVRKSLRTRKDTAPSYAEDVVGDDDKIARFGKRPRRSCTGTAPPGGEGERDQKRQKQALPLVEIPRARPRESKPLPPDSSRNLECDIAMLVEDYLGRSFPAFGKAPVMELSTKSRSPKFSRMSGVTEWKNAVFLWVNVDEGEGYANLFERSPPAAAGGTRVAGCLATEGSPKRALLVEKNATENPGNPAEKGGDIAAEPAGDLKPGKLEENGRGVTEKLAGDCEEGGSTVEAALSEELRMTWYAGGRMAPESALIRRLLKCSETEGDCDAADRAVVSPARSSDVKLKGGVAGRPQQGDGVFRSQQNEEGTTRDMAKAKVDLTTETEAVAAEVWPNGATSTLRARAKPESAPHKQAKNDGEGSSKFAAAAVESVAGESAVHLATGGAADQPESGSGSSSSNNGSSSSNNGSSSSSKCKDSVLLFCRRPKEPYVFCGRLGYAQHWSAERPVRFVWRLLDAGLLSLQPDFGGIVEAAGIGSGGEKVEK